MSKTKNKVLAFALAAALVMTVLPVGVLANVDDDFVDSGLSYRVLTEDSGAGTVEVIGSHGTSLTEIVIPETVSYDGINYDVTRIVGGVFNNNDELVEVTIGDSVETIGDGAFSGCDNLETVTIGDSVKTIGTSAFACCEKLTTLTLGDSVETIGTSVFLGCTGLTTVDIGDSVETIGESAFAWCSNLETVTIGNSVKTIGTNAFSQCIGLTTVDIGDSVETIGTLAFAYCGNLETVTIGDSVKTIGTSAFFGCTGLTTVDIGDSVETIGEGAFAWCSNLETVTIGDSVKTIGTNAFSSCTNLQEITFGESVTSIVDNILNNANNLKTITFKSTQPPTFESGAFNGISSNLTAIYVPEGSVEAYKAVAALSDYASIIQSTALQVGDSFVEGDFTYSILTLNGSAGTVAMCAGSLQLTEGNIPASVTYNGVNFAVTKIDIDGFYGCTGLTAITIPDSVETIGEGAFEGCAGLTTVTFLGATPPQIAASAFMQTTEQPLALTAIYVPSGSVDAYKAIAGLSDYTNIIRSMGPQVGDIFNEGDFAYSILTLNGSVGTVEVFAYSSLEGNIPAAVTYNGINFAVTQIEINGFYGCTGLTAITIPDSVKTIGDSAFSQCTGLRTVSIGDAVETIGTTAFVRCTGLTTVSIPDSVQTIGGAAFYGCTGLKTVTFLDATPPQIAASAFMQTTEQPLALTAIYVPSGSVDAYKAIAALRDYTNIIVSANSGDNDNDDDDDDDDSDSGSDSDDSSSNGGSGSGSGAAASASGSAFSQGTASANVGVNGAVSADTIAAEAKAALQSKTAGSGAVISTQNAHSIAPATLQVLANATKSAGGSLVLQADTILGNAVQGRLYLDPAKHENATADIQLGVYTDAARTAAVTNMFGKYFDNAVRTVALAQQGSFGARVQIAAKVDLTGLNTQNLYLYSYNAVTNSYKRISNPAYWIDANGYLHFYTELGGSIIITDKPLARR